MHVDDYDRSPMAHPPIPESGRFLNRRLSVSERVYRFLERMRFVVPETPASMPMEDEPTRILLSPRTRSIRRSS